MAGRQLQLDDLVYDYPRAYVPDFQALISQKKEFKDVGATATEDVPKRGKLFKHQKFLLRLMRQYDDVLVMWRTGTGKTCGVFGVTEYFKNLINSPIKRVYYLVKGPNLKSEATKELVCKCTDGDYETKALQDAKSEQGQRSAVTRAVGKFYSIMTYGSLAKKVKDMSDDKIIAEYSGSIFVVDEAQNLRIDETAGTSLDEDVVPSGPGGDGGEGGPGGKGKGKGKKIRKKKDKNIIYDQLHRLFHLAKRSKRILLSATPMINKADEIVPLMNLLLPNDEQIPSGYNVSDKTVEEVEPYFRGKISYVRELDTGIVVNYVGEPIDKDIDIGDRLVESQLVVDEIVMSKFQTDGYRRVSQVKPKDITTKRTSTAKQRGFIEKSYDQRQASNFVFPDKSTGSAGFNKYIVKDGSNYRANTVDSFRTRLSDPANLKSMSKKFHKIVDICKDQPGNCWCYSDFLTGAGAILLGVTLDANGFERFSEVRSVFGSGQQRLRPFCAGSADRSGDRKVLIPTALRYALLTSETSDAEAQSILETFNSYENRHGEYIKVVIGSPVTQAGLNLANVLNIILMSSSWNEATSYQAISRAIRSTSHVDLIAEQAVSSKPEPVQVDIYRMASIPYNRDEEDSIDLKLYEISEIKSREIANVTRQMKQTAVDCQINRDRNIRSYDEDYTSICDYSICNYKCIDDRLPGVDKSSYNILYSHDKIKEITNTIVNYLRQLFVLSLTNLYDFVDEERLLINMAVSQMIDNNTYLADRYGYKSYVGIDNGTLFLQRTYPIKSQRPSYDVATYVKHSIGIDRSALSSYIDSMNLTVVQQTIESYVDLDLDDDEDLEKFTVSILGLPLEIQKELLENSITNFHRLGQEVNALDAAILDIYKCYITSVPLSRDKIDRVHELASKPRGRGRKPSAKNLYKRFETEVMNMPRKEGDLMIYTHTLLDKPVGTVKYNATSFYYKVEKIRIFIPMEGENEWRDPTASEHMIYGSMIKTYRKRIRDAMREKYPVFGSNINQEFRIIDNRGVKITKDSRKNPKGIACSSLKIPRLLDIMYYLDVAPFNTSDLDQMYDSMDEIRAFVEENGTETEDMGDDEVRFYAMWYILHGNTSEDEMIRQIKIDLDIDDDTIERLSDYELKLYYAWVQKNRSSSKADICKILEAFFKEHKMLIECPSG
jgi:superfamily II DNA or RNA helicase